MEELFIECNREIIRERDHLIKIASQKANICFEFLDYMHDRCILATDSGGNKRYVLGYLDNGTVFYERATA